MPKKRKAGAARVTNLLVARETLSTKRRKSRGASGLGCTQVQGASSFATGYIGRVGEAQRCLDGSLYLFVSQEAEELTFFDMPWVPAIDI